MEQAFAALVSALADRYRVEREIGHGGMADVLLARDLRHDRPVAIKVLRPEIGAALGRERFLREIRIAAGLTHPHILPLHDSGEAADLLFYVMPFVDGESLRDRLSRARRIELDQALAITREVADALDYAHREGVIHRDIKPENILISGGHALVADFGIARAARAAGTHGATEVGVSLGTPHYMSPEQISGGDLDGRTDVYSLGCVLYEMLAGSPPFAGTTEAVMARHLVDPVPPLRTVRPDLPGWVESAVVRALAKSPADRFSSAGAMGEALAARGADIESAPTVPVRQEPGAAAIRSLVVLPLANFSNDPAEEFFADGMTEALITDLAKIRALRVISRSSAMRYKGVRKPLPEIARELNVDTVVEGSVLRSGGRVRITAQLLHAPSDTHLWAERYERELSDVLALQGELAQTIAAEIRVQLTPEERRQLERPRAVVPAALEEYLKGRFHWAKRTDAGFEAAIQHFRRAIERDPEYALAYTGLADTSILLAEYGNASPEAMLPAALDAARRALEIDEGSAEAHNSMAYVKHLHEWDWKGSEREFLRALELNPNYAVAHHWYARNLLTQNRWDDAAAELEAALRLDPLSLVLRADVGYHGIATRRLDRAVEVLKTTVEMDPHFPVAHLYLGLSYLMRREFDAALEELGKARSRVSEALTVAATAYAQGIAGRRSGALATLAELESLSARRYVAPYLLAIVHVGLGDHDRAFVYLDQAFAERHNWLVRLAWEPYLDPLRDDPRFTALMRRVGVPERGPTGAG